MRNKWGHGTFGICKHLGIIEKKEMKQNGMLEKVRFMELCKTEFISIPY